MAAKYSAHSVAGALMQDPSFWAPVAATAVGLGMNRAQNAITKMRDARARASSYKEMLSLHPKLRSQRDGKQVRRLFTSLSNINPTMAKDPLVAGAWVDNVMENNLAFGEGSNQALLEAVKDLSGIRSQMSRAKVDENRMQMDMGSVGQSIINNAVSRYSDVKQQHGEVAALKGQIVSMQEKHKNDDQVRRWNDASAKYRKAEKDAYSAVERQQKYQRQQPQQQHGQSSRYRRKRASDEGLRLLAAVR